MADTLIFLPVWNQAAELPGVLEDINRERPEGVDFLIINNGSDDGSEDIAAASTWPVLDLPSNRGVGGAFVAAFNWAQSRHYTFFGSMAANGKMLARDLPRLLEPLRTEKADYVTGSRFLPGGESPHLPLFRRVAIPAVNVLVWLTTGSRVTDATNGFRIFRLGILEAADWDLESASLTTYGFEYYLYAKALIDRRITCTEIATTMRYPAHGRYSKIRPGRDWFAMLKPWIVARLDRYGFGSLPWLEEGPALAQEPEIT